MNATTASDCITTLGFLSIGDGMAFLSKSQDAMDGYEPDGLFENASKLKTVEEVIQLLEELWLQERVSTFQKEHMCGPARSVMTVFDLWGMGLNGTNKSHKRLQAVTDMLKENDVDVQHEELQHNDDIAPMTPVPLKAAPATPPRWAKR